MQLFETKPSGIYGTKQGYSRQTCEVFFFINLKQPQIGQISTSCQRLATDATLHCVPWRKLRRWAPPTRYTLTGTKRV